MIKAEAFRFDGQMDGDVELWLDRAFETWLPSTNQLEVHTVTGRVIVGAGDWIVRDATGAVRVFRTETEL